MKSILINFIIETVYNFYILFKFISFVIHSNIYLVYNNDNECYISKFRSNSYYLSVYNDEYKLFNLY